MTSLPLWTRPSFRWLPSLLACVLLALVAAPATTAQANGDLGWVPFNHEQFDNNTALDEHGNVRLFWKIGDTYSTYGIASRSKGYLALGFSETGAMTAADMAVGYTNDRGDFALENRHASGFVTPRLSKDQKNNIRLKEGHQTGGVTAFIFEKKNTANCLQEQADVHTDSWQWFIYAFSDENAFEKHKPGNNGKKYVKLGTGKTIAVNEFRKVPNSKNFTITQPEITIPTNETTYCYTLHKLPAGKKNFLLGERPETPSKLLHHLVVYSCYDLPEETKSMIGQKPNCDFENFNNPCNSGQITEWAPGMSGRTFEPGYGKPFGSDSYEYVMLETHYNNPEGLEDQKSTAGYTFLYTDEQVATEVGTLTLGNLQVFGWTLEPGKKSVSRSTICTPECTKRWPAGGITAVAVFHHMHQRGRNAKVQIVRDGKEIAALSSLRGFEYGYQYAKSLNEVKLLPGDKFITTCEYDTSKDTKPVPGGIASKDEMCFAWLDYYPANQVLACTEYELGSSPQNQVNGSAATCVEAYTRQKTFYASEFLTAPFEHLAVAGNSCDASTASPKNESSISGASILLSADRKFSTIFIAAGLATLFTHAL